MRMKLGYFYLFFIILALSGCDDNETIILSDKLTLRATLEGEAVKLDWNKPHVIGLTGYNIYRRASSDDPWSSQYVTTISENDSTSYIDRDFSLASKLTYYVQAISESGSSKLSNFVEVNTGIRLYKFIVHDAVLWKPTAMLYLVDETKNKLYKYDLNSSKLVDSLNLGFSPGYIDVGDNGFGNELYIPKPDGFLLIYDATTLSLKDSIKVFIPISSVVSSNKGYLALSVYTDWAQPLRVYDRKSKTLITGTGEIGFSRLRMITQTNEIFGMEQNSSHGDCDYCKLDNDGNLISNRKLNYQGYNTDADIFQVSSGGNYLIMHQIGNLFDKSFQNLSSFGDYWESYYYNDFCFDDDENFVFCGSINYKMIEKYGLKSQYSLLNTYKTKSYPKFLFMFGDKIIIVGQNLPIPRNESSWRPLYTFIEKIDLK